MKKEGDTFEIVTQAPQFEMVKQALDKAKIKCSSAELTMIPKNTVQVTSHAKELLNLIEALEEHEDVQNVYSNFDIPEETMNHIIQGS
jgi:transcriptional/translational regulatory protein YebC/TACO1